MSTEKVRADWWAKECGCAIHDGPHWLHMHTIDVERHERKADAVRTEVARAVRGADVDASWIDAMSEHLLREAERIYGTLADNMKRHGVDRISPEQWAAARRAEP